MKTQTSVKIQSVGDFISEGLPKLQMFDIVGLDFSVSRLTKEGQEIVSEAARRGFLRLVAADGVTALNDNLDFFWVIRDDQINHPVVKVLCQSENVAGYIIPEIIGSAACPDQFVFHTDLWDVFAD